jgi:hypothetical protein
MFSEKNRRIWEVKIERSRQRLLQAPKVAKQMLVQRGLA